MGGLRAKLEHDAELVSAFVPHPAVELHNIWVIGWLPRIYVYTKEGHGLERVSLQTGRHRGYSLREENSEDFVVRKDAFT